MVTFDIDLFNYECSSTIIITIHFQLAEGDTVVTNHLKHLSAPSLQPRESEIDAKKPHEVETETGSEASPVVSSSKEQEDSLQEKPVAWLKFLIQFLDTCFMARLSLFIVGQYWCIKVD